MDASPTAPRPQPPPPGVIRFQDAGRGPAREPDPVKCSVNHLRVGGQVVTGIYREWPTGQTGPGGACDRCPQCYAAGDSCHLQVRRYISRDDAPSFGLAAIPNPIRQDVHPD